MSATWQGMGVLMKRLDQINRNLDRERVRLVTQAAKETLVPAMKAEAAKSPGKAGPLLAKAVNARKGTDNAVLVGPRGGKSGVWWRHFFVLGTPRHEVGGAKAGGTRDFYSAKRAAREASFKRTRGGLFSRTSASRDRVLMGNKARSFGPRFGPWWVGGVKSNPFVKTGYDRAGKAFVSRVGGLVFGTGSKGGTIAPYTDLLGRSWPGSS